MTKQETIDLLRGNGNTDESLFVAAQAIREKHFGRAVVLRAVVEMTNKCRVNCHFCLIRRDNSAALSLFMLTEGDLAQQARAIFAENINVVFIQGGEIPQTTAVLERVIPRILSSFDSPVEILLNVGNKTRDEYRRLKEAGAIASF